jgi:hypothetical protein
MHGVALSVVAAGTRRAVLQRMAAKAVRVSQQAPRQQVPPEPADNVNWISLVLNYQH